MLPDQTLFTTQFFTLLAVLDPIGHLTLFLAATAHLGSRQRYAAAALSVAMATVVLAGFGVGGQALLRAMGVSLLSFQIAGGLIMLVFAGTMVLGASPPGAAVTATAAQEAGAVNAPSVLETAIYPLTVPIIAGPGALLSMVVLMDNSRHSAQEQLHVLGVLAIVMLILLATFLMGERIGRVLGAGGANLLRRVLGLVLAAVAVNLVLSAIASWLHLPPI